MDTHAENAMIEATSASDEERVTFPQVVKMLMEAGVEWYHADLQRGEKTYYMPNGESRVTPAKPVKGEIARAFSAPGVEAAVRAIQQGQIQYLEFRERIAAAGCNGYFVSFAGRRAVYFGRTGDSHIEWFPGAK